MIIIKRNPILGLILMIVGLVLFFLSIGFLIFRILLAVAALFIVHIGMQMRGLPPASFFFRNWQFRFRG